MLNGNTQSAHNHKNVRVGLIPYRLRSNTTVVLPVEQCQLMFTGGRTRNKSRPLTGKWAPIDPSLVPHHCFPRGAQSFPMPTLQV